jgi:hypothetical protein
MLYYGFVDNGRQTEPCDAYYRAKILLTVHKMVVMLKSIKDYTIWLALHNMVVICG